MQTIPIIQKKDIEGIETGEELGDENCRLSYFDRRVILKKFGRIPGHWLKLFVEQDEITLPQFAAAFPEAKKKNRKSRERELHADIRINIDAVYVLSQIKHENIQQMYGVLLEPLTLVIEHPSDSGRLDMGPQELGFDYPTIRYILIDITMALLYLQSNGLSIHRFTNDDILIFREPTITAKLSILGCRTKFGENISRGSCEVHKKTLCAEEEIREAKYLTLSNLDSPFGFVPFINPTQLSYPTIPQIQHQNPFFPMRLRNSFIQPHVQPNLPIQPHVLSNLPIQPHVLSNLPIQPHVLSNLPIQPHVLSNLPIQPHVQPNLPIQPHVLSNLPIQPHVQPNLPIQPHVLSNLPIQPHVQSNLPIQPHVQSNVPIQPYLTTQPHARSNVRTQPHARSNVPTQPHAQSNFPIQPHVRSNVLIQPRPEDIRMCKSQKRARTFHCIPPESNSEAISSFRDVIIFLLKEKDLRDIPPLFHYLLQYPPDTIFDCVLVLNHIDPYHECTETEENFQCALRQQTKEYEEFYSEWDRSFYAKNSEENAIRNSSDEYDDMDV